MSEQDLAAPIYTSAIQIQINGKTRGKRVDEKKKKAGVEKPETAPELVVKPRRQFVDHGGDAKFKASFDGSESTTLSWSKDGKVLAATDDGHYKIYEQDGFHFLEVTMVTMEDHGEYTVTVENSVGSDKASADLDVFEKPQLLTREADPSWEKSLKDVKAHQDDPMLELVCVSKDLLNSSVKWFHDEKEVASGFHMKVSHEGQKTSLVIKGVRESDGGQFKCVMTGSNGQLESSCKVTVLQKMTPPVFVKELHDMEVEDGDKLELVVEVKGTPPVRVFWFHNNEEITLTNPHFLLASLGNVHTLTLPHASSQCAGQFVCEAYNDCGDTDTFCVIDVKELENPELPHFVMRPCNCTVEEGDDATFICKMRGQPMPSVVWEREGVEITDSSKHKASNMKELHSLTIYNVDPLDKGEYTCHLHNTQGNTSHTFQLFLMSDIIVTSKTGKPEGQFSAVTPKSTLEKEPSPGSQTERLERKEVVNTPKYSHSFMQPKTSSDTIVRSSAVRAKVDALSTAPTTDQNKSQDTLLNSPLFKKAKERSDAKGAWKSYDNFGNGIVKGSGDNSSNVFFGSEMVDFRERDKNSNKMTSEKFQSSLAARETARSKNVMENGLRNLQVERNFRNVLSRGSGDYKSDISNVSTWKRNGNPQGSITIRESAFQRSENKAVSPIGLKAVNKSLGSLGKHINVYENSVEMSQSPKEKSSGKSAEPTYSPSSSLQFDSNEILRIKSSALNSENNHSRESIDNAKSVIGDNLFRAEKRPTNMFEPIERPFNSQPSHQPVLHHARLTTLKKDNHDSSDLSKSSNSSKFDSSGATSSTVSDYKPTNFNAEEIPSIQINKPLQFNVNLNSKLSERVSNLEKQTNYATESKPEQFRSHSRLKGFSEVKVGDKEHQVPNTKSPSNTMNGKNDSTSNPKESGSVFTWGKRPSRTKDEMAEDTRFVSKSDQINHKPLSSNIPTTLTSSPRELSKNDPKQSNRIMSNKSDISTSSSRATITSSSSSSTEPSDFRNIKLKPTQKNDKTKKHSSSSDQLRKSKFLSKSTENVFQDVKLRPVSKGQERPKSEFNQENVARLRLKSKSTNFSDIDLVKCDDSQKEKDDESGAARYPAGEETLSDEKYTDVFSENRAERIVELKQTLRNAAPTNDVKSSSLLSNKKENTVDENQTKEFVPETKVKETSVTEKPDKRSEFMEKIRKWKTADFTEKLNKIESGSQTSRESEPNTQITNSAASTSHRHSLSKTAGTSHLDNVPEWVKQKALNQRNSLQTDKMQMPSNSSLNQTYRASLINTGEFSGNFRNNDSLNKTIHTFDRNSSNPKLEKDPKDKEAENIPKPSVLTKVGIHKRNENLITSSKLGHQRSAPDLKDKSKFESSTKQSELEWLNRRPIRNIEQMIKANSQGRIEKSSQEDKKPDWVKLKSPKDIKHEKLTFSEEKSNGAISSSKSFAIQNNKMDNVIDTKQSELSRAKNDSNELFEPAGKNVMEKVNGNNDEPSKPKRGQDNDDALISGSQFSSTASRNETESKFEIANDQITHSTEKSISDKERSNVRSKVNVVDVHVPAVSSLHRDSGNHKVESECRITSTPPTPDTDIVESASVLTNKTKEPPQQVPAKSQNISAPLTDCQPREKTPNHQQKQSQPNDQQALKNTPVRPSWMKQKSLRHIPIYPINDNELSPRYEPFRKSMDDTSSTNSVSSLASDASGLTTDSGYGKSVLADDAMNTSKETLLDRGNSDTLESEEQGDAGGDQHNKSSSTDNVFKLAASEIDPDTDSGFCLETEIKKDFSSTSFKQQNLKDKPADNTPHISDISESLTTSQSLPRLKESVRRGYQVGLANQMAVKPENKTGKEIPNEKRVEERISKYETNNTQQDNVNKSSENAAGSNTFRTPKSEFLKKRFSLTPPEDSTKESTTENTSKTETNARSKAIRPSELNISPNTERRNKLNGINSLKDSSQPLFSSSSSSSSSKDCKEDIKATKPHLKNESLSDSSRNFESSSTSNKLSSKDVCKKATDSLGITKSENANQKSSDDSKSSSLTPEESCPRFELPLCDVAVTYGSKATLRCHVVGIPTPDIQWLYDRKPLEQSKEISTSVDPSSGVCVLTVQETFTDHIGTYSCLASNSAGSVTTSARLSIATSKKSEGLAIEGPVSLPPRAVSLTPKVVTLSRNSTLTLTLNFVGEPTPTVAWKQGEQELVNGDGRVSIVTTKGSSILTIDHVTSMDTGKMTAVIINSTGSDHTSANICVEDIPGPPVGKPHVYGINRESASLSWCGPSSSGGSTINYYVIEAKTRQQTTWDVLVPQCKELSFHIFGLQPSATYQFRVRAANKEGLGPPSEPSERVITSDPFSGNLDESDVNPDELPFDPREVHLKKAEKFEDLYDLGPVVGKGKFGIVYKCTQKSDSQSRTWAAKVIKCREKDKAAIRQEVEVMNRLRHPKLLMLWDAFESPRQMVLVMEFIGAGELFERVIGEDFVLTERDCVHFLRQICEGVSYMHSSHVLHLDLKPENILCIAENSNRIKIIDFGLARIFKPGDSTKVLLGTPEFIAPEVINYDEVSFSTDMWSVGVICYVLLSGLSPFLGDNDAETLSNVTAGDFDFDDEAFDEISDDAKDFISKLLIKRKEKRMLTEDCLKHSWLAGDEVDGMRYKRLNTDRLKHFMVRRKWLKTGNAVLAVSRLMKTMSLGSFSSRSDSTGSLQDDDVTTPRSQTEEENATSQKSEPSVLQQNGSGDKPETDSNTQNNNSSSGDDFVSNIKDQNDNKLPAAEVITNVVGDNQENHSSVPLNQNEPASVQPSTCNNNNVSDKNLEAENASDIKESHQPCNSSTTNTHALPDETTTTTTHNNSTLLSTSSSSTLCPSSTSTLPSSSSSASTSSASQQPPTFIRQMTDSKAFVGDNVRFDVVVEGIPNPDLTWYFDDEKLQQGDNSKYSIESNESKGMFSLIIRNVDEDDDGEYVCKAVNSCGELLCSAELSVLEI